jgi:S1-C subfamily serine protease
LSKKGLELAQEALEKTKALAFSIPKSGTGFSIGEGCVVTTADVVEGMRQPVVIADDGTRIKAKVAGIDPDLNVAILSIPKRAELHALKWGDSNMAAPGYFAISIGNQTGHLNSAALNLISGIRDEGTHAGRRFYPRLLQIAGTVGAGTSGAPLLNTRGEVIGMMAAMPTMPIAPAQGILPFVPGTPPSLPHRRLRGVSYTQPGIQGDPELQPSLEPEEDQPSQGGAAPMAFIRPAVTAAGFAIPTADVKPVVEALREGRQVARGFIGVVPMDEEKLESDGEIARIIRKVRVVRVEPDSPACSSGIAVNDILVSFNGKPITGSAEVRAVAITTAPGTTLRVEVKRGVRTLQFDVQVCERATFNRKHKSPEKPMKKGERGPDSGLALVRFTH